MSTTAAPPRFADSPNRQRVVLPNGTFVRWTFGRWNLVFPTVFNADGTLVRRHFNLDAALAQANQLDADR